MAKKTKSKAKGSCRMLPVMHPDAAGVDIGAEEIFVAVPADRDVESVIVRHVYSGLTPIS
jgi:hypothetical protein